MAVRQINRSAFLIAWTLLSSGSISGISGQCPWSQDSAASDLQSACLCNLNSKTQALSVQCQSVDFPLLTQALRTYAGSNTVIENLFVNDSFVGSLTDFVFKNLKIISLQINGAQMIEVAENAFRGRSALTLAKRSTVLQCCSATMLQCFVASVPC